MKETQEKIKIKVYGNGEKKEVEIEAHCKGGLAIHERRGDYFSSNKWAITHISSGLLVSDRRIISIKKARGIVNELIKITDWTRSAEWVIKNIPLELRSKIQILDF